MKKAMIKALNLPSEIFIGKIEDTGKDIEVFCRTKKRIIKCPHCGGKTSGYDTSKNRKRHTAINGKKVWIRLLKRRLECKDCHKIFTESVPGMNQNRSTDFFNQLVQEKSRNQDYSSVSRELGISPSTVMYKQDLLSLDKFFIPKHKKLWLGLDGKYLNGENEIFVIGEVKEKQFLGVTKGSTSADLEKTLEKYIVNEGKTVELVTMDMSKLLKTVSLKLFPGADIVADKFHVIKYVNSVIDLCRIAVEKSVNERFQIKRLMLMKMETFNKIKNKPKWEGKVKRFNKLLEQKEDLRILWNLKNRIHDFYKSKTEASARERFNGIIAFLDTFDSVHPEFADLRKTLTNWKTEILNYFKHRITNGFIEGLNNRIETLKRKKFGFRNKERFIKTLLFAFLPITMFLSDLIFTHAF
jgi:transposase